jgi:hypothetical protein
MQLQPPPSPDELARASRRRDQVSRRAVSIRRRRVLAPRAAALVVLALAIALPLAFRGQSGGERPAAHPTTSGPVTSTTPSSTTPGPTTSTTLPQRQSTSSTTPSTTSSTTAPTTTTTPAKPLSETLRDVVAPGSLSTADYKVPSGKVFALSDYSLSVSGGSEGSWSLELVPPQSGATATTLLLGGLKTLKTHGSSGSFSPPVSVTAGTEAVLRVTCSAGQAACVVTALVSGTTSPSP